MKKIANKRFRAIEPGSLMLFLFLLFFSSACNKLADFLPDNNPAVPKLVPGKWSVSNIASNNIAFKPITLDRDLLNARAIAFDGDGRVWITSTDNGISTVYDKNGRRALSPISIPSPTGSSGGRPTGVVVNGSNDFILSNGQPAHVLFVGEDGVISGWNPAANNFALLIKNNASSSTYTGVTLAKSGGATFMYAANFKGRKIDVYDKKFNMVSNKRFIDPLLPGNYTPFNIQAVGEKLYVAYATMGPDGKTVNNVENGIVNIFNTNGVLLKRLATKGTLNSPWGIAEAPGTLVPGGIKVILISNSGDGRINTYTGDGKFLGQFQDTREEVFELGGLWAISFAPATFNSDPNRLYFSSSPTQGGNQYGLFGFLVKQ